MNRNIVLLTVLVIALGNFADAFIIKKKLAYFFPPPAPTVKIPSVSYEYGPPKPSVVIDSSNIVAVEHTTEEPLLNSADWSALFEALKNKAIDHNPIVKIYRYFTSSSKPEEVKPEYKFLPALGFTHYNKINYYPIVENPEGHKESDKPMIKYGLPHSDIPSELYPPSNSH